MSETDKIPASRWEENKEYIRALYLDENKKLGELMHLMDKYHGFVATKAQYIRKLGNWKMKKNATQAEWKFAEKLIKKRKREGKDTNIVMKGKVVSANKLSKEMGRYGWVQSYAPPGDSPQHSPSAVAAMTPPNLPPKSIFMDTVPWFQFQNSVCLLIKPTTTPVPDRQLVKPLANIQLSQADLSLLTAIVLGRSASSSEDVKIIEQIGLIIESEVPQKSDFSMGSHSTAFAHDPWFHLIEWAIYRCTNNLLSHLETYELLSFISARTSVDNLFREIFYTNGPTRKVLLSKLLIAATIRGHTIEARLFVELGADPESKEPNFQRMSVLQIASELQDTNLVAMLLQKKANPNKYDLTVEASKSPLAWALDKPGGYDVVGLLVNAGADVNSGYRLRPNCRPIYPLEQAVQNNELGCTKILIEAGASLDNPWILRTAINRQDQEIVKTLLGAGANCNGSVYWGDRWQTALELAFTYGNTDCTRLLIEARANAHIEDLLSMIGYYNMEMFNIFVEGGVNAHIPQLGNGHELIHMPTASRKGYLSYDAFIRMGNEISLLRYLLDAGADINMLSPEPWGYDQTPLQTAVRWCHPMVSKTLLDKGASPNERHPALPTTLQQACSDLFDYMRDYSTQRKLIDMLLESGADVNAAPATATGAKTALAIAIDSGDLNLVNQLIQHGGKISNETASDETIMACLEPALSSGNLVLVEFLAQKEPSIKQHFKNSERSLQAASFSGNLELVNWVIGLCTEITHWILQPALEAATRNGHSPVIRRLLDMGADVNGGFPSPLFAAIESRNREVFELLLARGADPISHHSQISPLVAAIRRKWPYAVRALLNSEISINQQSFVSLGRPEELPLLEAVQVGSFQCVEILLESGARADDFKVSGCLGLAISARSTDIVQLLLLHGADPNQLSPGSDLRPIHLALRKYRSYLDLDVLELLIYHGADVNAYSAKVGYPLQMARGNAQELLLRAGAHLRHPIEPSASIFTGDKLTKVQEDRLTKLQKAAGSGNIQEVQLLISKGEYINAPAAYDRGMTALQHASIMGHFGIVVLLLENGANTNAPGAVIHGRKALEGAAENGRLDIVHLLLENDTEPGSLELRCQRAAKYAENEGHEVIARVLREWRKD